MTNYYNGQKLLSSLDLDGNKPEIYICETNRTAGKTTYFGKFLVQNFLKTGQQFGLIYRSKVDLNNLHNKFFPDIQRLYFPSYEMRSEMGESAYSTLYLNDNVCGYGLSLRAVDKIKQFSHLFSSVGWLLFDDFQLEDNSYLKNEVQKLISLHTSIARGHGQQARRVPIIMISNTVSLINPYFLELGISARLKSDTKFLRGHGWILEHNYIESAAKAQMESGFNRAFAGNKYVAFSAQNVYLNDNQAFIEKPTGQSIYYLTLRYNGKEFGIRKYNGLNIIYCDKSVDPSCTIKRTVVSTDHNSDAILVSGFDPYIDYLRRAFDAGIVRFRDLECKMAFIEALRL